MAIRPTEIRAVAAVLNQDYDSAEAAAEAAITALDAKRADDARWVAVVRTNMSLGGEWLEYARGVFSTKKQAQRALLNEVSAGPGPWYGSAVPIKKEG